MSSREAGGGDQSARRIFVCQAHGCGLRFPVQPRDRFAGTCPRCGGRVMPVGDGAAIDNPTSSDTNTTVRDSDVQRQAILPCPLHLLLDNWRSLFNVGSAFRTADGAGVARLHLCGITATPENPRLDKTALQAQEHVAWAYAPDGVRQAAQLRAQGATLWALERTAEAMPLFDLSLPRQAQPVVLLLGNEVSGLDPGLLALADRTVYLPMAGHKESLNVAIAASVAVYWLVGQAQTMTKTIPAREQG